MTNCEMNTKYYDDDVDTHVANESRHAIKIFTLARILYEKNFA